jgi:putative membrane protein insertion efficiency factor
MPRLRNRRLEKRQTNEIAGLLALVNGVARTPRLAALVMVRAYRYTLSSLMGFRCRHLPTCSEYAEEAIGRFGLWAGGWMTLARVLRCHPFGTAGLDFVPAQLKENCRWYMPWRYGRWRGTNAGAAEPGPDPAPSAETA